jgi:hypothetical protein
MLEIYQQTSMRPIDDYSDKCHVYSIYVCFSGAVSGVSPSVSVWRYVNTIRTLLSQFSRNA